jgi:hypothetical protein
MIVKVVFGCGTKIYAYNTDLNMLRGGVYDIVSSGSLGSLSGSRGYDSYVTVIHIASGYDPKLRTITEARLIKGPRKPEKPYKQVVVNKSKRTICVVWKDGTHTVMKCHSEDEWDEEKGIAMCFMKKVFQNRGCYYDTFRDVTYMGE